jgi:hypothetical protein
MGGAIEHRLASEWLAGGLAVGQQPLKSSKKGR